MIKQRTSHTVNIGTISIGGNFPIAIQSMTNTPTENVKETSQQILDLNAAGAQIVRITINDIKAALAVPKIIEIVRKKSSVPLVGDFY